MAKRGRKPKERKGYFYEKEEQAIVDYTSSTNQEEKNKIFNSVLMPALTKMIESIIRRYKLFVPEEEFQQTFNDTISYLLTKIKFALSYLRSNIRFISLILRPFSQLYLFIKVHILTSRFQRSTRFISSLLHSANVNILSSWQMPEVRTQCAKWRSSYVMIYRLM